MRNFICAALAAPTVLVAPVSLAAPKAPDAPATLAEKDRAVAGGRAVQIVLAQQQIATSVDIGRVMTDDSGGGGLLGMLIISGMDDKRERMTENAQQRADATVVPLREALGDFDVAALALASTERALAIPQWFAPQRILLSADASPAVRSAFVADGETPQIAFITYNYGLSPDFTQIRVNADIRLARRVAAKGDKAATVTPPFYRQTITSIVELPKRSYDHGENVALWSAADGALAKSSLTAAFAELERLIPYALNLAPAELKAFDAKDREKAFGAGLYGPLVSRAEDGSGGLLIWTKNGLVNVRPAR